MHNFPDFSLALILWLSSCHKKVFKWQLFVLFKKGIWIEDVIILVHTYKHHNFYSNDDFFTDNKFPFSTQKIAICWLFFDNLSKRTRAREKTHWKFGPISTISFSDDCCEYNLPLSNDLPKIVRTSPPILIQGAGDKHRERTVLRIPKPPSNQI